MGKKLVVMQFLVCLVGFLQFGTVIAEEVLHWGFRRGHDMQQAEPGKKISNLLKKYDAIYCGDDGEKVVYLTFDNGYENGYTEQILDVLQQKKVSAAFFVTGHYVTSNPRIVKRIFDEGHIIGNHSFSHADFSKISGDKIAYDLKKLEKEVIKLTGCQPLKYLRTPEGTFSESVLAKTKELGYCNVFWSIAYVDWINDEQNGASYAKEQIMKQLHPGAIILLHTVSKDNAEALETIIDSIREKGYTFRSLDEFQ